MEWNLRWVNDEAQDGDGSSVANSDLCASCTSSRCLSQGWCAETGLERLLTQGGPFPVLPASSHLQFELLMLSIVCGWRLFLLLV